MKIIACAAFSAVGLLAGLLAGASQEGKAQVRRDREMREHLSERQIDKMVEDSFPASDPPSTY